MRPRERRESGQNDLFKARLDQIVDLDHPLAKLARVIDWGFLETSFGAVYSDGPGQPPLPTRLMAGLAILSTRTISPMRFCASAGRESRSSAVLRRGVLPAQAALRPILDDALASAHGRREARRFVAGKPGDGDARRSGQAADFTKVVVDTTVQPKAVAFPTDARLMQRARERLVRLAEKHGFALRQSYVRVGKFALIKHQRYAHAKQFKRAKRALRSLKTYLGRVIRDIGRKVRGDAGLEQAFAQELMLARRVHAQNKNLRRVKGAPEGADLRVFSLHAPEVECKTGLSDWPATPLVPISRRYARTAPMAI